MAQKPETRFSKALHDLFPETTYVEKTNNPFRGGVPDFYYEFGAGQIMWCEHKFYKQLPATINLVGSGKLSALQNRWLKRARRNGLHACVITGFKAGNEYRAFPLFHPDEWESDIHRESVLDLALDLRSLTDYIHKILRG